MSKQMTQEAKAKKSKNELRQGGDAIKRERERKNQGRDRTDPTASDFDAGWAAGRDASNPKSKTPPKKLKEKIKKEYGGRKGAAREAYRGGYAGGSNRSGR